MTSSKSMRVSIMQLTDSSSTGHLQAINTKRSLGALFFLVVRKRHTNCADRRVEIRIASLSSSVFLLLNSKVDYVLQRKTWLPQE
jgi:hypothetical protein